MPGGELAQETAALEDRLEKLSAALSMRQARPLQIAECFSEFFVCVCCDMGRNASSHAPTCCRQQVRLDVAIAACRELAARNAAAHDAGVEAAVLVR